MSRKHKIKFFSTVHITRQWIIKRPLPIRAAIKTGAGYIYVHIISIKAKSMRNLKLLGIEASPLHFQYLLVSLYMQY